MAGVDEDFGPAAEFAVVVPVVRRPPQHALLRRRRAHEGEDELEDTVRLVRPVTEVAVVAGGDADQAGEQSVAGHRHVADAHGREEATIVVWKLKVERLDLQQLGGN